MEKENAKIILMNNGCHLKIIERKSETSFVLMGNSGNEKDITKLLIDKCK